MRRASAVLFTSVVAKLLLVGCANGPDGRIPTSAEARAQLARLVALAQLGDFDALCRMADGQTSPNCVTLFDGAGRAVPRTVPVVVAERTIEPDEQTAGGRVLTICGHADDGRVYASEMLVFYDAGRLEVIQPIWWSGTTIQSASAGSSASTGEAIDAAQLCS